MSAAKRPERAAAARVAIYIKMDKMMRKPVTWLGDSLDMIRAFPGLARSRIGRQISRLQEGLAPEDWKPMPTVGLGVSEIRVRTERAYRVIYVAKFGESIYVVHAFEKKAQRTPQPDIELARRRFKALIELRKQR